MSKKTLQENEMNILQDILKNIDRVKDYTAKINMYGNLVNGDDVLVPKDLAVVNAVLFLENTTYDTSTLEGLNQAVSGYLSLFTPDAVEFFDNTPIEYFTNKFYNEIPLYEAEPFLNELNSLLLKNYAKGKYYIDIYDFDGKAAISFTNQKDARKFVDVIGGPCTLYKRDKGVLFELVCV